MTAMIASDGLRVDDALGESVSGLTFATSGRRVLLLGAPSALVPSLGGLAKPRRGSLSIDGRSAAEARRSGRLAVVPARLAVPPKWTARRYVEASAELAGIARPEVVADRALGLMALGDLAAAPLGRQSDLVQRGVAIAAAIALPDAVIVLEEPLVGLEAELAATFAATLVRALEERAWAVCAARLPRSSPLVLAADEALVFEAEAVAERGSPSRVAGEASHAAVVVELREPARAEALRAALDRRGIPAENLSGRLMIDFPADRGARDVLAVARELSIAVRAIAPRSGPFL